MYLLNTYGALWCNYLENPLKYEIERSKKNLSAIAQNLILESCVKGTLQQFQF